LTMNKGGTVKSGQMSFHPFDLEDESCGGGEAFFAGKIWRNLLLSSLTSCLCIT